MNKVTVKAVDQINQKLVDLEGVPVRIGVIRDLFVATPKMLSFGLSTRWDVTHIPSGAAIFVGSDSPEEAARAAELYILEVGIEKYIVEVLSAMERRAKINP